MPKLDFSSLKTADLRSVAPLNDGIRPGTALPQEREPAVHEPAAGVSALVSSAPSAQPAAYSVPPAVPAAVAVSSAPSPVAEVQRKEIPRSHVAPARKISLTSLKSGGPCVVSKPVVQNTENVPASAEPAAQELPKTAQHAPIISLVKKEEPVARTAETSEVPVSETSAHQPVEGVDIIAPAKVIGTEGEAKALEILAEAMVDPEEAKKKAMDKAAEAIVIPEAAKEFFPNLEMDDDFFKDPLFDGIVPHKEAAAETVVEAAVAAVEPAVPAEAPEVAEIEEIPAAEVVETIEAVPVVEEVAAVAVTSEAPALETVSEDAPTAVAEVPVVEEVAAVAAQEVQQPQEAYVETVAKDLSSERKGGLAKLFWERKVLVRSLAGFFLVAFLSVGAFAFLSPSVKTSGPEALPPTPVVTEPTPVVTEPTPVVTEPTPVVTEDVPFTRIHSVRRPNHRKMPTGVSGPGPEDPKAPQVQEEALAQPQPQASGSALSPDSADLPPNAP